MDILLKSLASAVAIAIVLIISKYSSPRLAGAIAGVPIIFAISYVIITLETRSKTKEFLVGGIYGAFAAIFFCLILIFLNQQFVKYHWINFGVAYVLCFLFALVMVYFTNK